MVCCSLLTQKYWLVGSTTAVIGLALIIGLLWPTVALRYFLYPQLELKEGSLNFNNWKESPIPIYMEIFMFNWTNPQESVANHSIKPHFTEMGPYVFTWVSRPFVWKFRFFTFFDFSEKHIRTNITWHNNGTVTFNQKRIWHFDHERSNGSLSDEVTNLNVIAAVRNFEWLLSEPLSESFWLQTVGYSSRFFNSALKMLIGFMMNSGRGPITVTKTVKELLFDGYDDPLLTLVRANGNPDIVKVC